MTVRIGEARRSALAPQARSGAGRDVLLRSRIAAPPRRSETRRLRRRVRRLEPRNFVVHGSVGAQLEGPAVMRKFDRRPFEQGVLSPLMVDLHLHQAAPVLTPEADSA